MEEKQRRIKKLESLIENAEDSIANNQIIKELVVLRGVTGSDLEVKLKSCDKAIEDDSKYIEELKTLLSNETDN